VPASLNHSAKYLQRTGKFATGQHSMQRLCCAPARCRVGVIFVGTKFVNVCSSLKAERNPRHQALRCVGERFSGRWKAPHIHHDRSTLKSGREKREP
jgi:hypothetical protein